MRVSKVQDSILDNVFVVTKGIRRCSENEVGQDRVSHERIEQAQAEEVMDDEDSGSEFEDEVRFWRHTRFADYPRTEKLMTVPKSKKKNSQKKTVGVCNTKSADPSWSYLNREIKRSKSLESIEKDTTAQAFSDGKGDRVKKV